MSIDTALAFVLASRRLASASQRPTSPLALSTAALARLTSNSKEMTLFHR